MTCTLVSQFESVLSNNS